MSYLDISTRAPSEFDKGETRKKTKALIKELKELQNVLYASSKYGLLIVLQGMDASGKDGTIRNVFGPINPQGVKVKSFKKPTDREYAQDFLWRVHQHTPQHGVIQLFNRSHYEDILVPTVFKIFEQKFIDERYGLINSFESLLAHQNCVILKFYLHVSREEQAVRLSERVERPEKHWKHNPKDIEVAKKWDDFKKVYERIFEKCGPDFPWHIIPADNKWYRNYLIAKTVVEKLRSLNLSYPEMKAEDL
ncbi:MAG: polyphosphate kinase [Bacteroidia bacterium]|nr:polyphosphate kinase [Bacteroidia bacterium]